MVLEAVAGAAVNLLGKVIAGGGSEERERQKAINNDIKLKNLCTHAVITPLEPVGSRPRFYVEGRFSSPPGTIFWTCEMCGLQLIDNTSFMRSYHHWAQNPKEWLRQHKEFIGFAKKLGRV